MNTVPGCRGAAAIALACLAVWVAGGITPSHAVRAQTSAPEVTATAGRSAWALTDLAERLPAPVVPALGPVARHVVRAGESLARIALRYDMAPADLAHLNGLGPASVLLPGRELWVPAAAGASTPRLGRDEPTSGSGPELEEVPIVAGSGSGARTYVVGRGDTLYAVARRFAIPISDLRRWNALNGDGRLIAGQSLRLDPPTPTLPTVSTAQDRWPGDEPGPRDGATTTVHLVAEGETLTSIAALYGTTADWIRLQNGLPDEIIRAGEQLTVPRLGTGSAGPAGVDRRIEVVVGEQRMYVWQGETLVWNWLASTGIATHPTQRGTFAVQSKIENAWSNAWQLWMPHWLGIYWAGSSENGIHALPIINGQELWSGSLGTPVSYGCVVLGSEEAALLYDWAEIGTPVVIRD